MNKNKNIVIIIKGGMVQEVYSNDKNVSVSVIDVDVKKECDGLTSTEVDKMIITETNGLTKIIDHVE